MARDLYVKMLRSELFNPKLSSDALRLLLAVRSRADADEADGMLHDRVVAGLGIELGFTAAKTRRCLSELRGCGHIESNADEHRDVAFLDVCKSAMQRESERSDWRQRTERSRMSRRDTPRDTPRESRRVSQNTPSPSPSPSPSETENQPKANKQSARPAPAITDVFVAEDPSIQSMSSKEIDDVMSGNIVQLPANVPPSNVPGASEPKGPMPRPTSCPKCHSGNITPFLRDSMRCLSCREVFQVTA